MSIVIPVYNRLRFLRWTLDAVLAQTMQEWELVVVDDGSDEAVEALLAAYDVPRFSYLRQSNQGNAAARNTGASHTGAPYVAFLDSDDVWAPDMLRTCVETLDSDASTDVVYAQFRAIDAEGCVIKEYGGSSGRDGDLLEPLLHGYAILPSSCLVRRSAITRWGGFTEGLDDWEMWLRWAANGCRYRFIPEPLLGYRVHDSNLALDLPNRRATHFRMLDVFYSKPGLPRRVLALKGEAYALQYKFFGIQALQQNAVPAGHADLKRAVMLAPELLRNLDFWTQIACAHQGRLLAGAPQGLDLEAARASIEDFLGFLRRSTGVPTSVPSRLCEATSFAYMALGQLAYGPGADASRARMYFAFALRARPSRITGLRTASWLARGVIGPDRIRRIRRAVGRERSRG